jgi:hypothetical protein
MAGGMVAAAVMSALRLAKKCYSEQKDDQKDFFHNGCNFTT